jgi:hypothetical protein
MSTSKLDIEIEDEDSNNEQFESENESDEDHTPESGNLQEDNVPDKDAFLVDRESKKKKCAVLKAISHGNTYLEGEKYPTATCVILVILSLEKHFIITKEKEPI